MKKNLGLYIHIPFCEKKCDYCNFVSFCKKESDKLEYINALLSEISLQGKLYLDRKVDTIFIGGGTPSCLPDGEIQKLLNCVYQNFDVDKDAEITIEANPNSLSFPKLTEYKSAGINRLSIGLQTYNNKLLKTIGRLHSKKDFDFALKNAKYAGFQNISVDLILGLPGQKFFDVKRELSHLVKLGVKHISAYGLIVEDGTKLKQRLDSGDFKLPSEEKSIKMYDYTVKYLKKHGIMRYEVSNFAKAGYESKHNLKYWSDKEYLGLGLVSSSYVDGARWKNTDNFANYIESVQSGLIPTEEHEKLSIQERMEERIMLSLRTAHGIDLKRYSQDFKSDLLQSKQETILSLQQNGLIEVKNEHLFCTDKGFKFLNQIILKLVD